MFTYAYVALIVVARHSIAAVRSVTELVLCMPFISCASSLIWCHMQFSTVSLRLYSNSPPGLVDGEPWENTWK